jgi:hypothetical protein
MMKKSKKPMRKRPMRPMRPIVFVFVFVFVFVGSFLSPVAHLHTCKALQV